MNNARIFLAGRDEGQWIPMEETPYDQEAVLQLALAQYPDLLPGDQIDPERPRRWLLVRREMGVPAEAGGGSVGSLDHLYLDQDGIPTFVECKRAVDTRARREVVAQMLDYAANGTEYWPMDRLRQAAAETAVSQERDLDSSICELLNDDEADVDAYWLQVEENLRQGVIRLIFVADSIPSELRRLVEFLNSKMSDVEVLAVEVKQYLGHGQKAMVPRVIGMTEAARSAKGTAQRRRWDEPSFFAELETKAQPAEVDVARQILEWARQRTTGIDWGRGRVQGSFTPYIMHQGTKHQLFGIWTNGSIEFYFHWYQYKKPFDSVDKRLVLLSRLNQIPGVALGEDVIHGRPWVYLTLFTDPDTRRQLLSIFEWVIEEIRAS